MSMRSLCQAVLDQLRKPVIAGYGIGSGYGLTLANSHLSAPGGEPAPIAGKLWVSVHEGAMHQQQEGCSQESYDVIVTVTMRIDMPVDSIGRELEGKAISGLKDQCSSIRAVLVNNQDAIRIAANVYIDAQAGGPWDGFIEPLLTYDLQPAEKMSGLYFEAEDGESWAAISKGLRCSGATRIQRIGNVMT